MKKRTEIILISLAALLILSFFWFDLVFLKDNGDAFEKELREAGKTSDVVIIFNSGGWGTVPFDKALDLSPIVSETKQLIESNNYRVSIVQYYRTKENTLAKIASLREAIFNFPDSSKVFADKIDRFLKENPNHKVVMAGLSNGASFIDAAMEDLKDKKDNVWAIELGAPFWKKNIRSDNVISLSNQTDILANGRLGQIILSLIKAPFIWAYNNVTGNYISLSQALHVDGHDYYWDQVKGELTYFIEEKI